MKAWRKKCVFMGNFPPMAMRTALPLGVATLLGLLLWNSVENLRRLRHSYAADVDRMTLACRGLERAPEAEEIGLFTPFRRRKEDQQWLRPAQHSATVAPTPYHCPPVTPTQAQAKANNSFLVMYNGENRGAAERFTRGEIAPNDCSGMGGRYGLTPMEYGYFALTLAARMGIKDGDSVFEAGMGCGAFHFFLKKGYPNVRAFGSDFAEPMLQVARLALPSDGPFCEADLGDLSFVAGNSMGHVVSVGALEYLRTDKQALAAVGEMARVLKPGGKLATALNNEHCKAAAGTGMADKFCQPPSWWIAVAPKLGLVNVQVFREAEGVYGTAELWQRGRDVGRYTIIAEKAKGNK